MKLKKFKELHTKIKKIRKELIYNYDYSYYDTNLIGTKEHSLIPNEEFNEKYGSTRRGYELFKMDYDYKIGYSGIHSLREVTLNNDLIGYIVESKRPSTPYIKEANDIYDEILYEFKKILDVQDEKSLEYYLNENEPHYDFNKDSANLYTQKTEYLLELITEYYEDDDFKNFFNKIIK